MAKQTGPKTAEGKEKSSKNALKHGLYSTSMFVLGNETEEKWNFILNIWIDKLQPADNAELLIVTDIAHAQWRIRRARSIEVGMLNLEMDDQAPQIAADFEPPIDEGMRVASAFKGLGDKSRGLDHLHRYETRARRQFKSGLTALEQLRRIASPAVGQHPANPVAEPGGKEALPKETLRSVPAPPVKRPAAQQLRPERKNVRNEIPRPARRAAIARVRAAFGDRIPIKITLHRRAKRA